MDSAVFKNKGKYPTYGKGTYLSGEDAVEKESDETDANGKTSIAHITSGYYEISEIKMPAGYVQVEDGKIYIWVNDGVIKRIAVRQDDPSTTNIDEGQVRNWTVLADNDTGTIRFSAARAAAEDDPATPEDESSPASNAVFTVGNSPGTSLPSTGGPGTQYFTILGTVILAGAGTVFWRKWREMVII